MAKITYENLKRVLESNNEHLKEYVYNVMTNFTPTATNVAKIMSHLTNTSIHVTPEDKKIWDSTYQRAVAYADKTFASMTSLELKIVQELPTENINKSCIYLKETSTESVYEQFIYSDGTWVSLGLTSIDMSQFYTKEEIDALIEELKSTSQHTHKNLELLDLMTAAFTSADKEVLNKLKSLDIDSVGEHLQNAEIHINTDDRVALNTAKQLNAQDILDHLVNTAIHITPSQAEEWNGMLAKAREYTDTEIEKISIVTSVEELPDQPKTNVIYLIRNEEPSSENMYKKYIYVDGGWEKLGGNDGELPDMTLYCTVEAMRAYVEERGHEHVNKDILDGTEVAFTNSIMEKITSLIDNQTLTENHMNNETIHLTESQSNTISNLDSTIQTLVARAMEEQLGKTLRIQIVDVLPAFLGDVDEGVIYFVRKPSSSSSGGTLPDISSDEAADISISKVAKAVNYDKYIWSSENECWEIFCPGSMELSDTEITEILTF